MNLFVSIKAQEVKHPPPSPREREEQVTVPPRHQEQCVRLTWGLLLPLLLLLLLQVSDAPRYHAAAD
jgi:hypothetical protein